MENYTNVSENGREKICPMQRFKDDQGGSTIPVLVY